MSYLPYLAMSNTTFLLAITVTTKTGHSTYYLQFNLCSYNLTAYEITTKPTAEVMEYRLSEIILFSFFVKISDHHI